MQSVKKVAAVTEANFKVMLFQISSWDISLQVESSYSSIAMPYSNLHASSQLGSRETKNRKKI
jgi:hypothetical protein